MIESAPFEPWIRRWGADEWSWNYSSDEDDDDGVSDGSGFPGRGIIGSALSFWLLKFPEGSAESASCVFNLPIALAQDALRPDLYAPCDLAQAVQTWSLAIAYGKDPSIIAASCIFATNPGAVIDAIRSHPWMYAEARNGVMCIGHEGE